MKVALADRKKVVKTGFIFRGRGLGRGSAGASWRGMGRSSAGASFKGMGKGQGYGKVDGQYADQIPSILTRQYRVQAYNISFVVL